LPVVDLRERLDDYEVTAVPHAPPTLTLVWSEAAEPEIGDLIPTFGVLALLDDYRITRVPGRVAS
jgi:hypothetical protein